MAPTSAAGAETNDSSITKAPDSDNPNETAGINLPTAENRKISFLEKVETIGSSTAQDGTNGQAPDTHDAEITRKQSIPPPSKPPKSVLKQPSIGFIPRPPGVAPSSARPFHRPPAPFVPPIPPSSRSPPSQNPPLPDPGYYAQKSSAPSLIPSSGRSLYPSPPAASRVPDHMRRGQKSVPNSKTPSMLQECFSTENSPHPAPILSPELGAADLLKSGNGFEQETGESGAGPDDLLFASGRSRLKGTPMATRWPAARDQSELPSIVVWHLSQTPSPQDAENVLSDLLQATRLGDIGQEWITALQSADGLLQNLFKVADQITPVDSVLDPKSPCAEIIDLLLEHGDVDVLLTPLCRPGESGATGIRYLICKARSMGNPPGEPSDGGVTIPGWVADTAVHHAYEIACMSGADSLSMIPTIRLVESILPSVRTVNQLQRPIYRSFLEAVIRLIKRKELTRRGERPEVDPARRTAALHLISSTLRTYKSLLDRLEAESDMPAMPEKEWILEELGIANIVPYLQDENSHSLVRCMALRVLRDFADVDVEEVPRWEKLEDILVIAVDVLLWRTKWQHGHEETSRSLGIAKFCPHEDAYRIITSSPTNLVIPILSKALKADDKFTLLEPLLSLIVDHSKLKDKYWPFMLSMLLHCGCLSLFHEILLQPVPPEKDFLYRDKCRAKTDACIGLTRCFEQMRAKDVKTIPSNVGVTLVKLANDEQLPLNLRGGAGDAFEALKENITTSLEIPPEAPRPLNAQLDTAVRFFKFPYALVPSRRGGGYDGYEPPPPRMYASNRAHRPSSQPLSVHRVKAFEYDSEPLSEKDQPNVQPPTLQLRAASSEGPRTAISTFDENSKTPRRTFKSIVSDDRESESGVENPNPPDQRFHSNSLSVPSNGNKRGSGEDVPSTSPTPSVQSISGTDDEPMPFIPQSSHLPPSQLRALPRGKRGKKR